MFHKNFVLSASAAAIILSFSGTAWAEVDADEVVDAIEFQMKGSGANVEIGSSTVEGNDIILKEITFSSAKGGPEIPVGDLRLQDVVEDGDQFMIGTIEIPQMGTSDDDKKINFAGGTLSDVTLGKSGETDPYKSAIFARSAVMGPFTLADEDGEFLKMDRLEFEATPMAPDTEMTYSMSIDGIHIDATKIPDEKVREVLTQLGYAQLDGKYAQKGSWNPSTGRAVFTENSLSFTDVGSISIDFDIGGYTIDVVQALNEMNRNLADDKIKPEQVGMSMLGILQQLSLYGAQIRYDDASLTKRVVAFAAKQQGAKPEDIVNQTKGILPFMLGALKNPEFSKQVSTAVNAFLDDPKSITITSAPSEPIPATQIMGAAMSDPRELINTLQVKVTGN